MSIENGESSIEQAQPSEIKVGRGAIYRGDLVKVVNIEDDDVTILPDITNPNSLQIVPKSEVKPIGSREVIGE